MKHQPTSICALDSEGSQSPPNGQDSAQSALPKTPITQAALLPKTGQVSPTGEMSETPLLFPATSLPQAIPVSRFPLQDEGSVRQMIATSGRQCSTRLDDTTPIGAFSKMLLRSKAWFSPDALMTWRQEAISAQHSIFRLAVLDYQAWNGTSGLLRRVTRSDYHGSRKNEFRTSPRQKMRMIQTQLRESANDPIYLNPSFAEAVKGFPISASELRESAMPSRHPSRLKSCKPSED